MPNHSVAALVYKYNPNAIWIIAVYAICLLWFCLSLPSLGSSEIYVFGGALIAAPIYVKYSKKSPFKLRTWNEIRLIFSSDGIQFGNDSYPVNGLETAAFYLDTFNGFEYRERGPANFISTPIPQQNNNVYVRSNGDKSTVSFRHEGIITDFTFCLENYAAFCTLRWVMTDWSAAGVNVVWRQAFEDDFIVQEMEYYNTPSGLI
jgi:hypothetical protein